MFNSDDSKTVFAFRELQTHFKESTKPLLFWVGAGVSAWCGYPLWGELAEAIHSAFVKTEPNYNREEAGEYLKARNFPSVFQMCRDANEQLFYKQLAKHLKLRPTSAVFNRFISEVKAKPPFHIITTNIDESLENNLSNVATLQLSDFERCLTLLQNRESFVCKIHGSISSIRSTIFTTEDYKQLIANENYLILMNYIFSQATVVFVGYGLGDEYVVNQLAETHKVKPIFGDGPHFAILPIAKANLPSSIRQIQYIPAPHQDHRTPIQVVSEIQQLLVTSRSASLGASSPSTLRSAHLISDIYTPGTWGTSQTILATGQDDGEEVEMHIGHGLTNAELPFTQSTAMHDLTVGLLCFDTVYAPLSTLMRVYQLLGSDLFWMSFKSDQIKFIDWVENLVVVYPQAGSLTKGKLSSYSLQRTPLQRLRENVEQNLTLLATDGEDADTVFNLITSKLELIDQSKEPLIPELARSLLLRPSIKKMLGMSEGILPTSIPRWMRFPTLRLAHVAKLGAACQLLGISSAKLEFGSAKLAEPAFAAVAGAELADSAASYIASGKFDSDLNQFLGDSATFFKSIFDFRDTQEGVTLRKEVFANLCANAGNDVAVAINAGLNKMIPTRVLEAARSKFAGLYIDNQGKHRQLTSLWCDTEFNDTALAFWRARSATELKMYCDQLRVSKTDRCPCGSGDTFRFCCAETLLYLNPIRT